MRWSKLQLTFFRKLFTSSVKSGFLLVMIVVMLFPSVTFGYPKSFIETIPTKPVIPTEHRYLVKFKDDNVKSSFIKSINGTEIVSSQKVKSYKWVEIKVKNELDLKKIKEDKNILAIQKDNTRKPFIDPNDPYYSSTGSYIIGVEDQWNLKKIKLLEKQMPSSGTSGWEITTGSTSTIVAVIDTGIDLTHPDLNGNVWVNSGDNNVNGVDNDSNGYIDDTNGWNFADNNRNVQDINGHGTHVSGTIAAVGNNSTGIPGICWSCKIMPLKVINSQGFGYDSDIALAIHYAVDNDAKVINMSLGGEGHSQVLQDAVDYAWQNNVIVISAAGNDGASASDSYPGGLSSSLSVGATNFQDNIASFSNTGAKVDITAPGVDILSTKLQTIIGGCLGSVAYFCLNGTSMAAPHVAGVAALLYDLHRNDGPAWSAKQIRYALLKNTTDLGSGGYDNIFGYGLVNALTALGQTTPATDNTAPTASLNTPVSNYWKGTIDIAGTASDTNLYIYTLSIIRVSDSFVVKQVSGRSDVTNNTLYSLNTSQVVDGNYQVVMRVEDFMGNVTNSNTLSVTIDNTAPSTFNLSTPTNSQWVNTLRPTFTWAASTDLTPLVYDVYVDGGVVASNLSAVSYTMQSDLSQASHSWYIIAKDAAGNTRSSTTRSFGVDLVAPAEFVITVVIDNASAQLNWSTVDGSSGLASYQLSLDGGGFNFVNPAYVLSNLTDGNHTVIVRAFDNAGNYRDASLTFTINNRNAYLQSKADFNHDGRVDLSDLSILASNWLQNTSTADANNNGKVDLSDLSILAQNWGNSY